MFFLLLSDGSNFRVHFFYVSDAGALSKRFGEKRIAKSERRTAK